MNNLNSVLFEGTVSNVLHEMSEYGENRCSFAISSWWRQYNSRGELVRSYETRVRVVILHKKLVEAAAKKARNGCSARVVGRLAGTAEDNNICIAAEHIEHRPGLRNKNKEE
jgi:hypothetical protein